MSEMSSEINTLGGQINDLTTANELLLTTNRRLEKEKFCPLMTIRHLSNGDTATTVSSTSTTQILENDAQTNSRKKKERRNRIELEMRVR